MFPQSTTCFFIVQANKSFFRKRYMFSFTGLQVALKKTPLNCMFHVLTTKDLEKSHFLWVAGQMSLLQWWWTVMRILQIQETAQIIVVLHGLISGQPFLCVRAKWAHSIFSLQFGIVPAIWLTNNGQLNIFPEANFCKPKKSFVLKFLFPFVAKGMAKREIRNTCTLQCSE